MNDIELAELAYSYLDGFEPWEAKFGQYQCNLIEAVSAVRGVVELPLLGRIKELEEQLAAVQRADPEAWKTPLKIKDGNGDTIQTAFANTDSVIVSITSNTENVGLSPADAARAAVWLASYAQAHGVPVDLGVQPNTDDSDKDNGLSGVAGVESNTPAPIAPAETLEALARVGWATWRKEAGCIEENERSWQKDKPKEIAATAAILRAARPTLDVTPEVLRDHCITSNAEEFLAFLNSRIRYGVELSESLSNTGQLPGTPPAAPTDAQIEEIARLLHRAAWDCVYDPRPWEQSPCQDSYRAEARAAYAHIGAELAAVTAERDLYKPYYDAVIEMAVVNWTLDGLSEKDANHAIQRLILQHVQEACDPLVNEELAKRDKEIAKLRAELAARTTRPVRVRFDVTAEEYADWKLQTFGWGNSLVYAKQELDYLLDKAVLDVPPGVPSVEKLYEIGSYAWRKVKGYDLTLDYGKPHSADIACAAAIRDAVLVEVGECQECAAAKRAVQIERDGVNALAARINAARAALEGEA